MELIKITKNEKGEQLVSARELWEGLKIDSNFTTWFKRMCEYGFLEDEDFIPKWEESNGGRPSMDFIIKMDMAKEISMLQRSDLGKKFRKYFIEAEKKLKQLPQLSEMQMIAKIAENADRQNERITAIEYKFENILTIDSGKQRKLQKAIAKRVYERSDYLHNYHNYGDNDKKEDVEIFIKKINKKLFPAIHRELKNKFGVSSYKDVKDSEFDIALNFVSNWIENADVREMV